jgi:ribosomal protein S18 acetylase RimI-like enzyme
MLYSQETRALHLVRISLITGYSWGMYVNRAAEIRDYRSEDGAACHELRRAAFLGIFRRFLPKDAFQAGAESYGFDDFAERIGAMATFVATVDESVVGFCSMQVPSPTCAELLYLYIGSVHRGAGLGSRLVRHAEQRVSKAHPNLEKFFLDTAVPEYNQSFWERVGYRQVGTSFCDYPTGRIPAVRLEKGVARVA